MLKCHECWPRCKKLYSHSVEALCTLESKVFVSHLEQLVNTHKLDKAFVIVAETNNILTRESEL